MEESISCLSYVKLAKSGDEEALLNLLDAHKDRLFRIALAISKNRQEAEDALQETFLKAYKDISKLRHDEYFSTWITKILINNARTMLKKSSRYLLRDEIPTIYRAPLSEDEILVNDLLGKLKEKERIILYLRFFGGFGLRDIALILRCPESTVKTRLYRGLENIRKGFDINDEK